jgi:hypothetical protein
MSSIDGVTASFTASLALAEGGGPVDIGHMACGSAKRNSQSYFLGKVLMHKEVDKRDLQNHFCHIWIFEKSFRLIEKPS